MSEAYSKLSYIPSPESYQFPSHIPYIPTSSTLLYSLGPSFLIKFRFGKQQLIRRNHARTSNAQADGIIRELNTIFPNFIRTQTTQIFYPLLQENRQGRCNWGVTKERWVQTGVIYWL